MEDKKNKEGRPNPDVPRENGESGYALTTEISRMSFEGQVPAG